MKKLVQLSFFLIVYCSCSKFNKEEKKQVFKPSNLSGKELAQSYCGSCHLFPEPSLLDKATWENGVLPKMYARLGLEEDAFKLFGGLQNDEILTIANSGIYPDEPLIAKEDWTKIVKFYIENAPDKPLPQDKKRKPIVGLKGFNLKKLPSLKEEVPSITAVKFNTKEKTVYLGIRGNKSYLKKYDLNFKEIDSIAVNSPVSDISFKNNSINILSMGIMDPNDQKKGSFSKYNFINKSNVIAKDSLQRPVHINFADLNQDNIEDYIICNFGNELGKLVWYDGKTKKENVLNNYPGARNTIIKDLNKDGLPDIAVLMAQANEQIIFYINIGQGKFEEKSILKFPPVYGSSYFELVDFNNDGFQDILYTNGDNADLSISLKKYHGIRIFMNDGKNNFKQSYFYPMFGASKATAADFDLDGDLDFAAISFFTDPNQKPNEGFLFFENNGNNSNFHVSTFKEARFGKWMVMDVADMDLDGDMDIVLGSFYRKNLQEMSLSKSRQFLNAIILENKIK